jgi:hypothetical protein
MTIPNLDRSATDEPGYARLVLAFELNVYVDGDPSVDGGSSAS